MDTFPAYLGKTYDRVPWLSTIVERKMGRVTK